MVLTNKLSYLTKFFGIGLAITLIATVLTVSPVFADDESSTTLDAAQEDQKAEEEVADLFVVPDGTPEELLDYIKTVLQMQPEARDKDSVIKFLTKSQNAVVAAADKVLASDEATKKQVALAAMAKFRGLATLIMQVKDPSALKTLRAFPKQLRKLKQPQLAKLVTGQLLQVELLQITMKSPDAKPLKQVVTAIEKYIGNKPDRAAFGFIMRTTSSLAKLDKKAAVRFCKKYVKLIAASDDPDLADRAELLEGTARRIDLVGNPMKVIGKTLDGSEFDWSSYKGKVVLVQFWATWCGPCRRELPSILDDYEKYHDQGFDVVGISLDRGLEPLEEFLKDDSLPWTIIYNGSREEEEEHNLPNVKYYGVMGIPELILVGRDGKVIATGLRGGSLTKELKKLFGAAETE